MNNSIIRWWFSKTSFYSNAKQSSVFSFYSCWFQNKIQTMVLNMACFLWLLNFNGQFLDNHTRLQKIKIKQKYQYLSLKVGWHDQESGLIMNINGLKLISRQDKGILPRFFSTIHSWWRQNQWNYILWYHCKCQNIRFDWFMSLWTCNQICSTWQE